MEWLTGPELIRCSFINHAYYDKYVPVLMNAQMDLYAPGKGMSTEEQGWAIYKLFSVMEDLWFETERFLSIKGDYLASPDLRECYDMGNNMSKKCLKAAIIRARRYYTGPFGFLSAISDAYMPILPNYFVHGRYGALSSYTREINEILFEKLSRVSRDPVRAKLFKEVLLFK